MRLDWTLMVQMYPRAGRSGYASRQNLTSPAADRRADLTALACEQLGKVGSFVYPLDLVRAFGRRRNTLFSSLGRR